MQIAPAGDDMIIECKVNPADIGQLKLGQSAMIKIDAYDYSIYGALKGTVIHLSPDTLSDQNQKGQSTVYYKMNVRVNK